MGLFDDIIGKFKIRFGIDDDATTSEKLPGITEEIGDNITEVRKTVYSDAPQMEVCDDGTYEKDQVQEENILDEIKKEVLSTEREENVPIIDIPFQDVPLKTEEPETEIRSTTSDEMKEKNTEIIEKEENSKAPKLKQAFQLPDNRIPIIFPSEQVPKIAICEMYRNPQISEPENTKSLLLEVKALEPLVQSPEFESAPSDSFPTTPVKEEIKTFPTKDKPEEEPETSETVKQVKEGVVPLKERVPEMKPIVAEKDLTKPLTLQVKLPEPQFTEAAKTPEVESYKTLEPSGAGAFPTTPVKEEIKTFPTTDKPEEEPETSETVKQVLLNFQRPS